MEIVGMLFLFTIALFSIGYPLIKQDEEFGIAMSDAQISDLDKENIFTAINEIEFEYRMSKMDQDDYQEMISKYRNAALQIIRSEEQADTKIVTNKKILLDEIEHEVERMKKKLKTV